MQRFSLIKLAYFRQSGQGDEQFIVHLSYIGAQQVSLCHLKSSFLHQQARSDRTKKHNRCCHYALGCAEHTVSDFDWFIS